MLRVRSPLDRRSSVDRRMHPDKSYLFNGSADRRCGFERRSLRERRRRGGGGIRTALRFIRPD